MSKVVLSIPKLGVTYGGLEKNKELYVLSFVVDCNGDDKAKIVADVVNASNETLPSIAPEASALAEMKWVFVAASNLFERVTVTQPASLSGSGIILYPHLDPKGLLASYFVVVESQRDTRELGKVLTEVFTDPGVKGVIEVFAAGLATLSPAGTAAAAVMRAIISVLPKILERQKDRIWLTHSHSGFAFDSYGLPNPAASMVHDFDIANDRVALTLRLRVDNG